jgi:hypothetical protein
VTQPNDDWKSTETESWSVTVYVGGDISAIRSVCRERCWRDGLCVTVTPTSYIYTGGEEDGVAIGLINYARFPSTPEEITKQAVELGRACAVAAHQWSYSVVTPERRLWFTRRDYRSRK